MITIELKVNSSLIALAGNPFGKKIFNDQVKPQLTEEKDYCIVFPNHIQKIASSFIEGFFSYWKNSIGIDGIAQHIQIIAVYPGLRESIIKNLFD